MWSLHCMWQTWSILPRTSLGPRQPQAQPTDTHLHFCAYLDTWKKYGIYRCMHLSNMHLHRISWVYMQSWECRIWTYILYLYNIDSANGSYIPEGCWKVNSLPSGDSSTKQEAGTSKQKPIDILIYVSMRVCTCIWILCSMRSAAIRLIHGYCPMVVK